MFADAEGIFRLHFESDSALRSGRVHHVASWFRLIFVRLNLKELPD